MGKGEPHIPSVRDWVATCIESWRQTAPEPRTYHVLEAHGVEDTRRELAAAGVVFELAQNWSGAGWHFTISAKGVKGDKGGARG